MMGFPLGLLFDVVFDDVGGGNMTQVTRSRLLADSEEELDDFCGTWKDRNTHSVRFIAKSSEVDFVVEKYPPLGLTTGCVVWLVYL